MASIISELDAKPIDTGVALGITGGVIVAVLGFVALGAWLHVAPLYAGFLSELPVSFLTSSCG
jgi:hypothetical protein